MDTVLLARLQFALTIMFHYLFPPLTIGLGLVIVFLEAQYFRTREALYETAARFWTKIFALNFALGVATGIVMEFQFGTNWAVYSRFVGDVFGSALAAEGIFAFFLESGFLALLVFGWDRVSARMHFFAAVMVFLGSVFSSIWITIANSWQQTPAGSTIRDHVVNGITTRRAEIVDFWGVVFSPSSMHRLIHVWFGAFLLGTFFVLSISAWYLLHGRHREFARRSFAGALTLATIFSLAQLASGHFQARMIGDHQPAKLAAFEGLYKTERGAPLHLFGWPDDQARTVKFGLAIPGGLSFLQYEDFHAEVKGLDQLEPLWGKPPVWISFQAYHLMVAIGFFFIVVTLVGTFLRWRGKLFESRWLLWIFVFAVLLAFAANEVGWVATEVGRQPWVVYPTLVDGKPQGGLLTAAGISEVVTSGEILGSILGFGAIYALLFVLWLYLLNHKIQQGPEPARLPAAEGPHPWLETAAEYTGHEESLTERREG